VIFVLVFVSHDFEVGRNVTVVKSRRSVLHGANLLNIYILKWILH